MQLSFAAITAILATAAIAAPNKGELRNKLKWVDNDCVAEDKDDGCLTDDKAKTIIDTYETLISRSVTGAEFNATVDELLDAKFFTLSNGINAEVGKPLEAISIPSPMAFKAAFSAAPPTSGTETLDMFHSCNKIAWRWLGQSPEGLPVRGLTMMNVTEEGKIADTYVEYFRPALINCTV